MVDYYPERCRYSQPGYIITEPGIGYRLIAPN